MSRRIEIEITSLNGELATWRAAGAKLPKGVLAASLVPGGPVVGNVYRADIEQYMEGIEVLSVTAPKTASPLDPRNERLELIPEMKKGPDVVVTYAPRVGASSRRRERREGRRRPTSTTSKRPSLARDQRRCARANGERPRAALANDASVPRAESERRDGPTHRSRERPARAPPPSERGSSPGARPSAPRSPGPPLTTTHRNALLATLSPEQLPVAEQLLRGGMPAVRAASNCRTRTPRPKVAHR